MSIEHYKWFFEEQSLEFWIPDWENNWSWLTIIVWPNNTWKTTIIESILIQTKQESSGAYWRESKFSSSERHELNPPKITIQFLNQEWLIGNVVYTNIDNWSQVKRIPSDIWHNILFDVIQSRRFWQAKTSQTLSEEHFLRSSRYALPRNSTWVDTAAILKTINADPQKKETFNRLIKSIINITWWTIDTDDENNDFIVYNTWSWGSHQSWLLWDWVISVFRICAQLINSNNTTIIIDEPELSLHPQAQKKLAKVLSEKAKDRQIIICTHSPYFINRKDLLNWAKFVRLNKYNDDKCTIHQLWNPQDYLITEGSLNNYQQPEFLDIASKEIMFSEKILFVEWKEDVWLIKKFIKEYREELNWEIDFDIFWYWSWWWPRIKKFLKMASDMWIKKVWAIYDWDVEEGYVNEVCNLFPNYDIERLNTDDIRDKNKMIIYKLNGETEVKERKEWIFYENWEIKDDKKDYFKSIIQNLIVYYNS